jgi:ribosomal protein L35
MSTQKTNKSMLKRFRVTSTGKIKARKPGFNHFNSKQSRSKQLNGKVPVDIMIGAKDRARFFPHS